MGFFSFQQYAGDLPSSLSRNSVITFPFLKPLCYNGFEENAFFILPVALGTKHKHVELESFAYNHVKALPAELQWRKSGI